MKTPKMRRLVGALAVSAMVLAACTTDEGDPAPSGTDDPSATASGDASAAPTASGERVSSYLGQPESLTPTNNTESEGNAVLNALFTMLIDYDPETNEPVMANAESIETEDNQTYTVTLKDGWTFHDGTPVTSESYVNAWNYAAYGPNAQSVAGFFAPIAGYGDLQCGTKTEPDEETGEDTEVADCDGSPPAAEGLSGLTVNSDTEFTVELTEPEAFFITRLGYASYAPLPEVFYDDPAAYDRMPIGNGPFMMASEWQDDVVIETDTYPDYAGDDAATIGGIEFRIYADVNTAITDLIAGDLDLVDAVPPEQWEQVTSEVPNSDTSESSSITYVGFPTYQAPYDNPTLRAALSMAIDREAITEGIFNGLRQPAYNILAPVIPGYEDEVCDAWNYDPEMAKQLFDEAGGLDGPIDFWFNEGAAHDVWVDAVVTQWEANLGIDAGNVTFQSSQFAEYLETVDSQSMTGPFRLGWGMDYPHPQNYLQILLELTADEGGNNGSFWKNEDYSAKIQEALAVPDVEESLPIWQEANDIACSEAPVIPMFYGLNSYAWNDGISDVKVDAFSNILWSQMTQG